MSKCKKCGSQLSPKEKKCVNCGHKPKLGCFGIIAIILGILFSFAIFGGLISTCSENSNQKKQATEQKERDKNDSINTVSIVFQESISLIDLRKYYKDSRRLNAYSKDDIKLISRYCALSLPILDSAIDDYLKNKDKIDLGSDLIIERSITTCTSEKFNSVELYKPISKKIEKAQEVLTTRKSAEEKRLKAQNEKEGATSRKAYSQRLREKYLDDNMDVKVSVSGKNNTTITLQYALFNDVWSHKMEKGDLISEIRTYGFKKLEMTDGYDWSVYWDL